MLGELWMARRSLSRRMAAEEYLRGGGQAEACQWSAGITSLPLSPHLGSVKRMKHVAEVGRCASGFSRALPEGASITSG